ncbi:MAG: quinolinate synthase NadA, partial [Candidatus Cloacimonetes bacterium]|nr:quinolinate synthase NadA [Candidatus Cloacimonadota bacterium]
GDSLQLSLLAQQVKTPLIVFCGVRFMAETAAILNPEAKVIIPVLDAGCPMADMITEEQLLSFRQEHPEAVVVCYVNSTVEVKAESDICCTSSNAVKVMQSIPQDKEILFVPDQNLGTWAAVQTKRKVTCWHGYCPVHQWGFTADDVKKMKAEHPDYTLLAHPECTWEVVTKADLVMSTSGMMKYAEEHDKLIIATELGLIDLLNARYPQKSILPLSKTAVCQNMKKTTLSHVLDALKLEQHHISVLPGVAKKAVNCLKKMLALSG